MDTINALDQLKALGLEAPKAEQKKEDEDKSMFLKLFITQLQNQDPLNPQEGAELLSQLAQFSTVEGINNIENTFTRMESTLQSSQALEASSLVGRQVQVPADFGVLKNDGNVSGIVNLTRGVSDLRITIEDASGQIVHEIDVGETASGEKAFTWDGKNDSGEAFPPGLYKVSAKATLDGENTQFETFMNADVESVTIGQGPGSILLNLLGHGPRNLTDVKTIN